MPLAISINKAKFTKKLDAPRWRSLCALTSEEARQQAQAEGLTLRVAESTTGYYGVNHLAGRSKPYKARVTRSGKAVYLGCFATAEEAALCVARSPEGQVGGGKGGVGGQSGHVPSGAVRRDP